MLDKIMINSVLKNATKVIGGFVVGAALAVFVEILFKHNRTQQISTLTNQELIIWFGIAIWCLLESVHLLHTNDSVDTYSEVSTESIIEGISVRRERELKLRGSVLFIATFTTACFVFRSFLASSTLYQGDWNNLGNRAYLSKAFPFQSVWTFGAFGSFNVPALRLALPTSLITMLARLGLPFSVSERVVYILPFLLLSIIGAQRLLKLFTSNIYLPYVGSLLYTVNFVTVNWYAGGWYPILLAYSLLPWQVVNYLHWRTHRQWRFVVLSALTAGLIATLDVRIAMIAAIPVAVMIVIHLKSDFAEFRATANRMREAVRFSSQLLLSIAMVSLILSPLLVANYGFRRAGASLPQNYYDVANLTRFSFYTIADTLNFFDPWWPQFRFFNVTTLSPLPVFTAGIVFVCSLTLLRSDLAPIARRLRLVGFICIALGSELATGHNFPIPQINVFFWQNIPGFDLFRNPEVWNPLIAIGFLLAFVGFVPEGVSTGKSLQLEQKEGKYFRRPPSIRMLSLVAIAVLVTSQTVLIWQQSSANSPMNLGSSGLPSGAVLKAQDFLSSRNGYVLWLPLAPVSTTDSAVSSMQTGAIATAQKSAASDLSQLEYGSSNSSTGTSELSWIGLRAGLLMDLLTERDVGYIALDTSVTVWTASMMFGERGSIVDDVQRLHLPVVFRSRNVTVYMVHRTSLIDAGTASITSSSGFSVRNVPIALADFGPVVNNDNYESLSPRESGLYRRSTRCRQHSSSSCLEIGIRVGSAVISSRRLPVSVSVGDIVRVKVRSISTGAKAGLSEIIFHCSGSIFGDGFQSLTNRWHTNGLTFQYLGNGPCKDPQVSLRLLGQGAVEDTNYNPPISLRIASTILSVESLNRVKSFKLGTEALRVGPPGHTRSMYVTVSNNGDTKYYGQDSWSIRLPASVGVRVVNLWTNYNSMWTLSCNNGSQISHSLLDGWANAFLVSGGGSAQCSLLFLPQTSFDVSLVASWLTVLAALSFVFWDMWRSRRVRRELCQWPISSTSSWPGKVPALDVFIPSFVTRTDLPSFGPLSSGRIRRWSRRRRRGARADRAG